MTKKGEVKSKRVVVISDLHCGHVVGLTHPDFNPTYAPGTENQRVSYLRKLYWRYFEDEIKELRPIDALIVNGDCIDGKGDKSGGTELLTGDRNEQCDMAVAAIQTVGAGAIYMSYGTTYHTGKDEDFEDKIAKEVKAVKIGSHDWLDVNGLVLDYRHHISSSSVPYGRHTAIAKAREWNVHWANIRKEYPAGDVFIRSHVHYFQYAGDNDWLGMTTPALQGYGSKFGARITEGTVDFGFVFFDVMSKGTWEWGKRIMRLIHVKDALLKLA